jgi:hypothetical protein
MGLFSWLTGSSSGDPQRGRDDILRIHGLLEKQLTWVQEADGENVSTEAIISAQDIVEESEQDIKEFLTVVDAPPKEYGHLREFITMIKGQVQDIRRFKNASTSLERLIERVEDWVERFRNQR